MRCENGHDLRVPCGVWSVVARVVHEGHAGLAGWIRTTWMPYTDRLPEARRAAWIDEVVTRYAERVPPDGDGNLHVPSFRVELEAVRPNR